MSEFKYLKPVNGTGPKEGATVAVFERGTAALVKAAKAEEEAAKK